MMKYNIENLYYIVKLKLKLLIFPTLTKYIDNKQMINRNYQCPTLSKAQNCHSKFEKRINKTKNNNYIGNKTSTRIKVSSTLDHYRVCVSHVR